MKKRRQGGGKLPRRRALQVFAAALGSAALGGVAGLTGCTPRDEKRDGQSAAEAVRIPLDRLAVGERTRVTVAGVPVELHRTEAGVDARSLRCPHFGCTVAWKPEREAYVCPCHDGAFGPDGRVIYGPPDRPLDALAVERDGDAWVIRPLHSASQAAEMGS